MGGLGDGTSGPSAGAPYLDDTTLPPPSHRDFGLSETSLQTSVDRLSRRLSHMWQIFSAAFCTRLKSTRQGNRFLSHTVTCVQENWCEK